MTSYDRKVIQRRVAYLKHLDTLPHAPADSVYPCSDIEHEPSHVSDLCVRIHLDTKNPIHGAWLSISKHSYHGMRFDLHQVHRGLLAESMWLLEMTAEAEIILRRDVYSRDYALHPDYCYSAYSDHWDDIDPSLANSYKAFVLHIDAEERAKSCADEAMDIVNEIFGNER